MHFAQNHRCMVVNIEKDVMLSPDRECCSFCKFTIVFTRSLRGIHVRNQSARDTQKFLTIIKRDILLIKFGVFYIQFENFLCCSLK